MKIYVASFPLSKQLKLGSQFPRRHEIQTSRDRGGGWGLSLGDRPETGRVIKAGSLSEGSFLTRRTHRRQVTSIPGGNVFKACNSQKEILSRILVSSSLSTSFILFYVAYQRDLQPRGRAISHGARKVPFSATIYVPPEQPKQLHFLNPNATGDLALQS